jgi:hypothetical protein
MILPDALSRRRRRASRVEASDELLGRHVERLVAPEAGATVLTDLAHDASVTTLAR